MLGRRIAILGAGSWGTALAIHLVRAGHYCSLWGRNHAFIQEIKKARRNTHYLPDFKLPSDLNLTSSLDEAVSHCEIILMAIPSHGFRETLSILFDSISGHTFETFPIIVSCAKGIENKSLLFMSDIIIDLINDNISKLIKKENIQSDDLTADSALNRLKERVAVLSGPSFAKEVAAFLPTAITIASSSHQAASLLQETFSYSNLRCYTTQDIRGVEVGGAVKNVLAIAVGISDGMGLGANARAALITRGLREIARLGVRLGADPMTLSGLSGLGDLVLTCTGELSRNRQVGLRLGRGEKIDDILSSMNMVAEGVKTSMALYNLGASLGCDMPISFSVYKVLYKGVSPDEALNSLLSRPLKPEWE